MTISQTNFKTEHHFDTIQHVKKRFRKFLKKFWLYLKILYEIANFVLSDDNDVPLAIQMSARAVIQADSAIHKEALEAAAGTWDGEKLEVSKYAENLEQLDNGVKIPPKGKSC